MKINQKLYGNISRKMDLLHDEYEEVTKNSSTIFRYHDKEGNVFEINPASESRVKFTDNENNVHKLTDNIILKPDTKEREDEKTTILGKFYNENFDIRSLSPILTTIDGEIVISPTEFNYFASQIWGKRPAFVNSRITESFLIKLVGDFLLLNVSKYREAKVLSYKKGSFFSRQNVTRYINGFARCISGVVQESRKILLKNCSVWQGDETPIICIEVRKNRGNKLSYVWAIFTGKHEKMQGALYFAAETRNIDEFLRQYECYKNGENIESLTELSINSLVVDCYSVYKVGINQLKELLNKDIKIGGCYSHLRRKLLEALTDIDMIDTFNNFQIVDNSNIESDLLSIKNSTSRINYYLLHIAILIEILFYLDHDFAITDANELLERRQKFSKPIVDKIYEIIDKILQIFPKCVQKVKTKNNTEKYNTNSIYPWSKFIVYALNNKKEFYAFTEDGNIEIHNNRSEGFLRYVGTQRKNMQFLYSKYGYRSYADLMSLYVSCLMNNINAYKYLHWVFANIKLRIEKYRTELINEKGGNKQILKIPKRIKNSSYDDEVVYDKISYTGLDIWSYIDLINKEKERINK